VERSEIDANSEVHPGRPSVVAEQIEFARVRRRKEGQRRLHRFAVIQGDIGVHEGRIPKQRETSPPFVKHVKKTLRHFHRHTTSLTVFADDADFGCRGYSRPAARQLEIDALAGLNLDVDILRRDLWRIPEIRR
jgi:hypothetical protein